MTSAVPPEVATCADEPIRIPGSIQPHGALLVLDARNRIVQASANAQAWLKLIADPADAPGLAKALPPGWSGLEEAIAAWLPSEERSLIHVSAPEAGRITAVAHRSGDAVILEFEPGASDLPAVGPLQARLQAYVEHVGAAQDVAAVCAQVAVQVRALTGFSRTLVYRFSPDWTGVVVAEDGDGALPSYLGLRFPASDIPEQARELYRLNRVRIIPDCDYAPSPVVAARGHRPEGPLELGLATLRSVSPVHLQYMRNMGTPASMSVSIVVEGRLWGLVSCHNAAPRQVPLQVRNACDFLVQVMAVQLGALVRSEDGRRRMQLAPVQAELLAAIARPPVFTEGLAGAPEAWLGLAGAAGAAWVAQGETGAVGRTPTAEQLRDLADWLRQQGSPPLYSTDALAQAYPPAAAYADVASGLLAIHVSELHPSYLFWFRPEMVRETTWGGDPNKSVEAPLTPRGSFETWKELVRGRAAPWSPAEVDAAADFRCAVLGLVLRQAEERAELARELQRSNRELEAFSYSVSHDLRAPFRHIVGYAELLQEREAGLDPTSSHYVSGIRDAALSAGRLVDDLLRFSQIGRAQLAVGAVDMNKIVAEARRSLAPDQSGRAVAWRIGRLPPTVGDPAMLRQALLNLLSNALKYTRPRETAEITVEARQTPEETVYTVRDNGVGFDMAYADKLFGVFHRLHRAEEFEGTGIGLAITHRVVERHGGRIWAESRLDQGTAFHVALPRT